MTKFLLALVLLLTLAPSAFAHGCNPGEYSINQDICLTLTWIDGPYLNERGERGLSSALFSFRHRHSEGELGFDPMQARYYPWMIMSGGHEHGARPVSLSSISDHEVEVSKIMFTKMQGEWFLRLKLEPQGSDDLSRDYDFNLKVEFN